MNAARWVIAAVVVVLAFWTELVQPKADDVLAIILLCAIAWLAAGPAAAWFKKTFGKTIVFDFGGVLAVGDPGLKNFEPLPGM
ncbi:MAG: hypothetical protein AB1626_01800 [Candidatus Micrarchaeota archaeon]